MPKVSLELTNSRKEENSRTEKLVEFKNSI